MKAIFNVLSISITFLLINQPGFAGGTLGTDEVLPILQQNPALYQFVTDNLDLDSMGGAIRIGSKINPDLGGDRIAPFTIQAKPKGSKDSWKFYLQVNAETTYYDDTGKEVSLGEGKSIKEKLTGIELIPIPENIKNKP